MTERTFYVSYGVVGEKAHRSHHKEMWVARRGAMALAKEAMKVYAKEGDDLMAQLCDEIRLSFLEAPAGELMFGLTIQFGAGEVTRFIAVSPTGLPYTDNQIVERRQPGSKAARRTPALASAVLSGEYQNTEPKQIEPKQTEAQRIGAAMAKAALKAVENDS